MQCQKCGWEQGDEQVECARCGVIFAKLVKASRPGSIARPRPLVQDSAWFRLAGDWLLTTEESVNPFHFAGRVLVFFVLVLWGWRFMTTPLDTNYTGESFLHLVNLPFHEAGHLLFMPFGRFMTILGGSLGQILMPLVCLGTFLLKTRDPFGGSVALWWTAENFMDVAPYINDARAMDLLLLGGFTGKEVDAHDWNNLLTMLGWLQYDHGLAKLSYGIGTVSMLLALAWGAILLHRQYRLATRVLPRPP
ncbi:MAG: zinc ribbon domain-containing protein [Nitrospirota bacterium]